MEHLIVVAYIVLQYLHFIKSFIEGAIGHGSAGCTGDWKLVQGLDCAGFSVTACTSWSCLP